MTRRDDVVAGRPFLRLGPRSARLLPVVAVVWALAAIVGLYAATELDLLHYRPGGDAYEIEQRTVFMIAFAIAIVGSIWSEVIGGTIASVSAAALMVFAVRQLEPVDAVVVVVVLAVPGVLWILLYLHDLERRSAVWSIAALAVAVTGGAVAGQHFYDQVFGPTHPQSATEAPPDVGVRWVWVGGTTDSRSVVVAELDDVSRRLAVATDADMNEPRWFDGTPTWDSVLRFDVDGLAADTRYHYGVESPDGDGVDELGSFRTFPTGPASFRLAFGSCARTGSNGSVFDEIRDTDPLLFLATGDFHYANITEDDPVRFVDALREALVQPAQAALYRSTSIAYVWDDHDFGSNNADATSASRPAAWEAYRSIVPHYPLAGDDTPIHQAFDVGRVRVIVTDTRSARSPASAPDDADKTMLGDEQLAWFERELLDASSRGAPIVWVSPVPWIAAPTVGGDDWGGYTTERREIADFLVANDITDLVMLSGDAHMIAADDGTNSDYSTNGGGGFPVFHAAALDRPGSEKGGPFSEGTFPGGGQFGVLDVVDDGGDSIRVEFTGRTYDGEVLVSFDHEWRIG